MGFSYTMNGRLCCDHCGKAGARKRRCPYGHCPSTALCSECYKGEPGKEWKAWHVANRCKEKHEAVKARRLEEERRIAAGEFNRCAALQTDTKDWVKVWFKGAGGAERIRYMTAETYHAGPAYCVFATEDDYRALGEVRESLPEE
jgi:hypothetical protein